LPFQPILGVSGTDYEKVRPDFRTVVDPYSGKEIFVAPPIVPDWAVIHAVRADGNGNVVCSARESDRLAVLAAKETIVTVEEIVPADRFAARPGEVFLSALHIDLLVVAPGGAHPGACINTYGIDRTHVERYLAASRTADGFRAYLAETVLGKTEEAYRAVEFGNAGIAAGKEA
jgi:glutaconate CoA-transferase subunit A